MMPPKFECCVCKQEESSAGALHTHHIVQHSSEELSLALLWTYQLLNSSSVSGFASADEILRNSLAKHPQFLLTATTSGKKLPLKKEIQTRSKKSKELQYEDDDSEPVMMMENKVVEEENSKENGSHDWKNLQEFKSQELQKTKWKKSLVDRSQAEHHQKISSEQAMSADSSSTNNNNTPVSKNQVKEIGLFLPDVTITSNSRKKQQQTSLLLPPQKRKGASILSSLLEKRLMPSMLSNGANVNPSTANSTDNPLKKTMVPPASAFNLSVSKISGSSTVVKSTKKEENLSEEEDCVMSQPPKQPKPYQLHSPDRKYKCERCECAYKKRSHLDRHMRSHTGERPFACNFCNKRFAVKSVLVQHIRIHTGEKPFVCSVCDARFPQTSGLMTHMMLHTGKPYKCDLCTKSFVSNHKLINHLQKNHEGTRPHTCNVCSLGFFTLTALEEHTKIMHLNVKKYNCDVCGASFKLEVSLKVHLDGHIEELGGDEIIDQLAQQQRTENSSQ